MIVMRCSLCQESALGLLKRNHIEGEINSLWDHIKDEGLGVSFKSEEFECSVNENHKVYIPDYVLSKFGILR